MVADIAYLQQSQQEINRSKPSSPASAPPTWRSRCPTPRSACSG